MLVGQALRLDVPRLVEVALDEALAASERRDGLAHGGLEQLVDLVGLAHDLEPATAATEGSLDRDGQAVLGDERVDLLDAGDRVGRYRRRAELRRAARCAARSPCRPGRRSRQAAGRSTSGRRR